MCNAGPPPPCPNTLGPWIHARRTRSQSHYCESGRTVNAQFLESGPLFPGQNLVVVDTSYAMQRRPHVVSTHSATQLRVCLFFTERVRDRPDINSTVMSNLFAFGIARGRLGGRLSGAGVSTDAEYDVRHAQQSSVLHRTPVWNGDAGCFRCCCMGGSIFICNTGLPPRLQQ